jgi:hypothetical protein
MKNVPYLKGKKNIPTRKAGNQVYLFILVNFHALGSVSTITAKPMRIHADSCGSGFITMVTPITKEKSGK